MPSCGGLGCGHHDYTSDMDAAMAALDLEQAPVVFIASKDLSARIGDEHLSIEERAREAKFIKREDRQRFRTTHFLKRRVCAAFTGIQPERMRFGADSNNKPYLKDFSGPFAFNLSHSGEWGGIAVANAGSLGFDVQAVIELAGFPMSEVTHPQDCIRADSPASAALVWAVKEAVVKANGIGLGHSLKNLCIERTPDDAVKSVQLLGQRWLVRHGALTDASAIAVAMKTWAQKEIPTAGGEILLYMVSEGVGSRLRLQKYCPWLNEGEH